MSIIVEGSRSVHLGAQAHLVEEDRELAWAEKYVRKNSAYKYVLGKYVEADQANENGQIFDFKELGEAQKSLANAPLNLLHHPQAIVGTFLASELIYPVDANTAGVEQPLNPYVEALAVFWKYYFPTEYAEIEKAYKEGSLYFSMEAVPKTVKCAAVCGQEFSYDGRQSPTYCAHLNAPGAKKRLGMPHFMGGALILPPVRPGWSKADITQVSALLAKHVDEAHAAYTAIADELPHLDSMVWEQMVAQVMQLAYEETEGESARKFTADQRRAAAKSGAALSDGSYPIETPEDLVNALRAFGRSAPVDRAKVKAHIKRRAKALGKESVLPDDWSTD